MKNYLNKVAKFIHEAKSNKKEVLVITSGGFTNPKSAPGISEAVMIASYLVSKRPELEEPIILEEKSRTTNENLYYVKQLIKKLRLSFDKVIVFCDSSRRFKVKWIVRYYLREFNKPIEIETYSFSKTKLRQLFIATPVDIISLYFPFIEKLELKLRARKISKS